MGWHHLCGFCGAIRQQGLH